MLIVLVLVSQIMVTAATTCAAVGLAQYCGTKHTFTVATVGVVTVASYTICCAFLTMHDQASTLPALRMHKSLRSLCCINRMQLCAKVLLRL